jgi:hypothetical protein
MNNVAKRQWGLPHCLFATLLFARKALRNPRKALRNPRKALREQFAIHRRVNICKKSAEIIDFIKHFQC